MTEEDKERFLFAIQAGMVVFIEEGGHYIGDRLIRMEIAHLRGLDLVCGWGSALRVMTDKDREDRRALDARAAEQLRALRNETATFDRVFEALSK